MSPSKPNIPQNRARCNNQHELASSRAPGRVADCGGVQSSRYSDNGAKSSTKEDLELDYWKWRATVADWWVHDDLARARIIGDLVGLRPLAAPQALGLSLGSYITGGAKEQGDTGEHKRYSNLVRFAVDGSLVKSRPLGVSVHRAGPGGKRGKIVRFSAHARCRMQEHLAAYKRGHMARSIFVTLTYPDTFPEPEQAKRHLDNFLKRLLRRYPEAGGIWRLEWQDRGAPHFHLIVLGVDFIPHQWVARSWWEVCGKISWHHLNAGTEARRIQSYEQSVYYVSKYVSKPSDVPLVVPPGAIDAKPENVPGMDPQGVPVRSPGRLWGHWGKWRDYQSEIVEVAFTREGAARVARTFDAMVSSISKRKRRRRQVLGRCVKWYANVSVIFKRLPDLVGSVKVVSAAVARVLVQPQARVRAPGRRHPVTS